MNEPEILSMNSCLNQRVELSHQLRVLLKKAIPSSSAKVLVQLALTIEAVDNDVNKMMKDLKDIHEVSIMDVGNFSLTRSREKQEQQ